MTLPNAFLDELRNRLSLSQVIGRRVRLVKRGREWSGLCPFHNEKSPSFTVNEDKNFFHCFGCGAHGDVIGFVMRSENLSFPDAVERLAAEAGIEVPRLGPADRERAERGASLANAMEAAAKWFEAQLAGQVGAAARDYLSGRGLGPETMARFRLGLAPRQRTALKEALTARGFADALLVEAGLLVAPEDGGASFDRFRNRIMFPIADRRGRVIAFGGRALDDAPAKYLNSPETPLFHKGRTLYNLSLARAAAAEAGTVIVAEGYMDVIALAQGGFVHAVAPLGTALTEEQMEELWRLAAEPILCFDGDGAGWRAALRAAERALPLLKPGRSFRFALLPQGLDPDDLIRQQGAPAMTEILAGAKPLAAILWRRETEGKLFDTPERRAALKQALAGIAQAMQDPSVQAYYRQHFEERLRDAFRPAFTPFKPFAPGQKRGDRPGMQPLGPPVAAPRRPGGEREPLLVAMVLNHPWLLDDHEEAFGMLDLAAPDLDRVRQAIIHEASRHPGLDAEGLQRQLNQSGFSGPVRDLTGPNAELAAKFKFARSDASREEVEQGWLDLLSRHRRDGLEAELKAALASEMTDSNLKRVVALKLQLQAADGNDGASNN